MTSLLKLAPPVAARPEKGEAPRRAMPASTAVPPGIAFAKSAHGIAFGSDIPTGLQVGVRRGVIVFG